MENLQINSLRSMELLKFTNMAPDFYPFSRRINGSILKYVPIGATKKMGKKTSHVVNFIVSMALTLWIFYNNSCHKPGPQE